MDKKQESKTYPTVSAMVIRALFQAIAQGTSAEAKAARAELNRVHLTVGSHDPLRKIFNAAFCDELLESYDRIEDAPARARYLGAIGEVSYCMRARSTQLLEVVFKEIMHASASVRLAAVRLAERLRYELFYAEEKSTDDAGARRVATLLRVRALIEQYAPREWMRREAFDPLPMPTLPPSVPKSLLLLWNALSRMGIHEELFFEKHPECALPFPVEWFRDYQDEEDDEDVSVQELAEELWQDAPPTSQAREALAALEQMAYERMQTAVAELGIDAASVVVAAKAANEREDIEPLQKIFVQLSTAAYAREWHVEDMSIILREMQGYSNHILARNLQGEPYSRILAEAAANLPKAYTDKASKVSEVPAAHLAAHRALDVIVGSLIHERKLMHKRFKTSGAEDVREYGRLEACRSIGHFVLDWYVRLLPEDLFKRSPERIAAVALDVVLRFNEEDAPVRRWVPFSRKELSPLGGWKGNMGYASLSAYATIRDSLPEPELLVLPADTEYDEVPLPATQNSPKGREEGVVVGTAPEDLDAKELEMRLPILFDRYGIGDRANITDIKTWVYESGDARLGSNEFQAKFLGLFPPEALNQKESYLEVFGAAVDAWNAFPHKALGGKSPLDMIHQRLGKERLEGRERE